MKDPKLFLMVDNSPEFEITDKLPFVEFLGIDIDTPSMTNNYQDNANVDGSIFNISTINKNVVNVRLSITFGNYYDLKSKTESLNKFFYQKRVYRLRTSAEPMMVQFVRPVGFEVKPIADGANDCFITIPFENQSGYKFSRCDSLNQLDLWDDFPLGKDEFVLDKNDYQFSEDNGFNFSVFNPGGVPVDPYYQRHDFKVYLSYEGDRIKLTNLTNGSTYSYNDKSNGKDIILLNGVESFIDDQEVNLNSDFGFIKLERDWNEFKVEGCKKFNIKFKFPFMYV